MANEKNAASTSTATLTDNVDTTKGADTLAHEATETVGVVIEINKLLFEKVMAYKLRDVLPFTPAIKRQSLIEASVNEMISKYFESTSKSIDNAITMKQVRAEHPELFRNGKK